MIRILPVLLLAVLPAAGCAHRPPPPVPANAAALTDALGDRLAFAREVAWIKYRDGLPVRDPVREEAVLNAVTRRAEHSGLEPQRVRAIIAAQIRASCLEQARWLRRWRHGDPLPVYAPRALNGGVRDDIDAANLRLMAALADYDPTRPAADFARPAEAAMRLRGFGRAAVHAALEPWR